MVVVDSLLFSLSVNHFSFIITFLSFLIAESTGTVSVIAGLFILSFLLCLCNYQYVSTKKVSESLSIPLSSSSLHQRDRGHRERAVRR